MRFSVERKAISSVVCVSFLFTATGCYSVIPQRKPAGPQTYAVHAIENSVHLGIKPFFYSKAKDVPGGGPFDINLKRKKVLILQVEAVKTSDDPLEIQTSEIQVTLPGGSTGDTDIRAASVDDAAKKAKRSAALVVFPWVVPLISILGIIISAVLVHKSNKLINADFRAQALPNPASIGKEQPAFGYVYFVLAQRPKTFAGTLISVPVINKATNERFVFEKTLQGEIANLKLDGDRGSYGLNGTGDIVYVPPDAPRFAAGLQQPDSARLTGRFPLSR